MAGLLGASSLIGLRLDAQTRNGDFRYVKACGGVPAVGAFLLAVAVSEARRTPRFHSQRVCIRCVSDAFGAPRVFSSYFFLLLFSPMSGISELLGRVAGALERLGGRLRRPRHLCAGGADLPRPAPIGFGRPRRQEPGRARQSQAEPGRANPAGKPGKYGEGKGNSPWRGHRCGVLHHPRACWPTGAAGLGFHKGQR